MGFSLLETLLTLILIAITAATLLWRWPTADDPTGRAQQLAGEIRLTQTLAMSQGGNWSLLLLPPNQVQRRDSQNLLQPPTPLGEVQLVNPASLEIRFKQDGSPSLGVGQYTITNGQIQRSLTVEAVTGGVFLNPP